MSVSTEGDVAPRGGHVEPIVMSVRAWRAERLLTIRELARLANVAPSTIYMTEAGRTMPRPSVARRIAATLGVDPRRVVEF
jgi:transcriptional regulator with XRE-family HTH domain